MQVSQIINECCGMHEILNQLSNFDTRPTGPRTYKPLRQRARPRFAGDTKLPSARQSGDTLMDAIKVLGGEEKPEGPWDDLIDRATLCLPHFGKDSILHGGDEGFNDVLRQYFPSTESNASERLVDLKSRLKTASTHDFWGMLMEEMCDIMGSQCGFVAKRMLVDDQDSAIEMPELGEPGSCLMGVAFYVNDGANRKEMYRDYRYHAYGTPCAHMKHDKVFIVPERLSEFLPNNPNPMPWKQSEAFIGLPLFTEGKCFAHFGMIWSLEGARKRKLSWSFIEMFLHSLEDMILQRILEGRGFSKDVSPPSTSAKVIPLEAITASQSLKPYAKSLSHELRTPMQGVVGMLDIMYSTVVDAISNQQSETVRAVFTDLKNHIEVVQDSSRRAVEAADNVVHAYDLNMQMPEMPLTPSDKELGNPIKSSPSSQFRNLPNPNLPTSKKHDRTFSDDYEPSTILKRMRMAGSDDIQPPCLDDPMSTSVDATTVGTETSPSPRTPSLSEIDFVLEKGSAERKFSASSTPAIVTPTHRHVNTRQFMQTLVNDALRNGHPTSEVHTQTALGESIEFSTVDSRGDVQDRIVNLNIESDVPEAIITEEQHLQFAVHKLVDNAMKFTERGSITVTVKLARSSQVVEIWVVDTGCGIAEESRSNLFKPHFQEDASISRSRDGLGLSLFNAKAHVRKNLGGDLTLERSDTDGPSKGSEFLIRLPISKLDSRLLETPLVGTPPLSVHSSSRPVPWIDNTLLPILAAIDYPTTTSEPKSRPHLAPKPVPPKSISFNPNLSKDYPLNILIAEDNAINRNVAIGSLSKLGYKPPNITVAIDGLEAVRNYQESLILPQAKRFDAVLMDIWMPNMDGYEATVEILELARRKGDKVKVIAVTADITEDSIERAKGVGMQGFLAKPYKVLDIEGLIVEHFPDIREKREMEAKEAEALFLGF